MIGIKPCQKILNKIISCRGKISGKVRAIDAIIFQNNIENIPKATENVEFRATVATFNTQKVATLP